MDRLTPLAASFLQAEDVDPSASLAIGSFAVFDGPRPRLRGVPGRDPRSAAADPPLPPAATTGPARPGRSGVGRRPRLRPPLARAQHRPPGARAATSEIAALLQPGDVTADGPQPAAVGVLVRRGPRGRPLGRCSPSCTTAWWTASPAPTSTSWCSTPRRTPRPAVPDNWQPAAPGSTLAVHRGGGARAGRPPRVQAGAAVTRAVRGAEAAAAHRGRLGPGPADARRRRAAGARHLADRATRRQPALRLDPRQPRRRSPASAGPTRSASTTSPWPR